MASAGVATAPIGFGEGLGYGKPFDLMTKHVDAKLLGEHVRVMGCEFKDGRAELAPQVVQQLEESVGQVEDVPSGLMTASVSQWVATCKFHCAMDSEVCLESNSFDRRVADADCQGGDEAKGTSFNRRWEDSRVERDCTLAGEHLRGQPQFCSCLPFGQSRSRGGVCFSTILCH